MKLTTLLGWPLILLTMLLKLKNYLSFKEFKDAGSPKLSAEIYILSIEFNGISLVVV